MPITFDETVHKEINILKRTVRELQSKVYDLENQIEQGRTLDKFHLMRVKNKEELSDDYLLKGLSYLDLSPEKAFELYNNVDNDFILLDVSRVVFQPFKDLPEAKKIPLEDLVMSTHLLQGRGKSIYIISECGVRSIMACKVLNNLGYYNLNNISGGYKFWPGFREFNNYLEPDILKEA